ncbi:MAG: lipopolysaccharide heptosyltransferase II [Pseudomonadota bacterium]
MSRRVLVVGPSWVGDMVMAHAAVQVLTGRGNRVDILAPGWSLPVIQRMPGVARGIELAAGHGQLKLGTRRAVARDLKAAGYAQAIVLPRSLKAALVPFFARIPVRTGFLGEHRYGLINDRRPFAADVLDQTVKRFVALALNRDEALPASLPAPVLVPDETARRETAARLGLGDDANPVALMPGAEYGPSKCWPHPHYRALADALQAEGHAVWVFGSDRDRAAAAAIVGGQARNLAGATSLAEAVDLMSLCRVAVTNDSGLMHVAAALGCHVIALYGSSSPAFTPPLSARSTVRWLGLDCSPCFERDCPLGHHRCLRDIAPDSVLADVRSALAALVGAASSRDQPPST